MAFTLAQHHDKPQYVAERYYERTQRNQFFVGGTEGQEHLRNLRVGVAGLGGMGSNIADFLIRLGVGHLRISDPDVIETSNIQRQVIASQRTVGQSKALVMRDKLRELADDFELVTYTTGINEETVDEFVDGCDVIVDEIDVYPLDKHVLLHRAARARGIPLYSAYILGTGIRFYKFHGDEFTFEDFIYRIKEEDWAHPDPRSLIDTFVQPATKYFTAQLQEEFLGELLKGKVPIFGPSALAGHSTVCIRLILDYLTTKMPEAQDYFASFAPTPLMPQLLSIDLGSLEVRVEEFK